MVLLSASSSLITSVSEPESRRAYTISYFPFLALLTLTATTGRNCVVVGLIHLFQFQMRQRVWRSCFDKKLRSFRVHAFDYPTIAFIGSGWRLFSKSWLAERGFFFRTDAALEGVDCTCPLKCNAIHNVD